MVFHVRHRLAKLGGNSFYRDRRVRTSSTFCGAPCTEYDAGWADRTRTGDWVGTHGVMTVCPACAARVAEEKKVLAINQALR